MGAPDKSCAGCRLYRRGRPKGVDKWAPNHGTCLRDEVPAPTHANSSACKEYRALFPEWEDDKIAYGDSEHDKAIRFDLDQAGIERREKEAIELVELRAEVERLKDQLQLYSRKLVDAADEIIAWKEATGLMCGGDADGVTPEILERHQTMTRTIVDAAREWLEHLEGKGGDYLDGIPGALMDAVEFYDQMFKEGE